MEGENMNIETMHAELDKIVQDPSNMWEEMPDIAGGKDWCDFISDTALYMKDYIYNEDLDLEGLLDMGNEYADGQVTDTYAGINKQVQELSLWASNDIDAEATELSDGRSQSLTDLNSLYLYCASRWVWGVVARTAFEKAEELEEVNA